ncbi:flavodoxin [Massilia sp. Dwa41.01b]|uniref:flavodoxin n=2 Tax=unclassified Massilia TaxID=2609279 RepID=UPI00160098FC|nr:flavodoxin [Massilia sp. Dwa41.01b]QNA90911.1 flavodoxin [Massilia sp. Dwa41.01b]QNA98232.1 flavodoxin [Massilia sp. Se16.2.3]
MKTAIYFGSTSGNTEEVADLIARYLGMHQVDKYDLARTGLAGADAYDLLVFGIPTWDGGNLQGDWEDRWQELSRIDFSNRLVALFGLGDQYGYSETYLDGMGMLHAHLSGLGARIVGSWPAAGYSFESSKALCQREGRFVGLALDVESEGHLTEPRVMEWCRQVVEAAAERTVSAAVTCAVT